MAFEQKAVPQASQPGIPCEDRRRLPVGDAEGVLLQIEGVVYGAGGTLVGGEDDGAALQRLLNLRGQRGRIVHTPFIRFTGAEKAASR